MEVSLFKSANFRRANAPESVSRIFRQIEKQASAGLYRVLWVKESLLMTPRVQSLLQMAALVCLQARQIRQWRVRVRWVVHLVPPAVGAVERHLVPPAVVAVVRHLVPPAVVAAVLNLVPPAVGAVVRHLVPPAVVTAVRYLVPQAVVAVVRYLVPQAVGAAVRYLVPQAVVAVVLNLVPPAVGAALYPNEPVLMGTTAKMKIMTIVTKKKALVKMRNRAKVNPAKIGTEDVIA
jgi:hypothetical protein